jgi:hypothetical protein
MITKCSVKFINWIISAAHINTDDAQVEVYVYGLECFLNTAITLISSISLSIFFIL